MPVINDFPFPMPGPRGGRPSRLQPPHPAAGSPPSILEILAEASTLKPPHPSVIEPGTEGLIADIVNNPDLANIPGEDVMEPAINLAMMHGATSQMPALNRTLREQLAEAIIAQLDSNARLQPTLARMMLRGTNMPTVDDLYGLEGGVPRLSNFFEGASPVDNPDVIRGKVEQLMSNLESSRPLLREGEEGALLEELSKQEGSVDESYMPFINEEDDLGTTPQINSLLRALLSLTEGGRVSSAILDASENGALPRGAMQGSIIDALITSGIGSGRKVAGQDPTQRRSLAPDMDAQRVRRVMETQGGGDVDLLMRLMGLQNQSPRGGV